MGYLVPPRPLRPGEKRAEVVSLDTGRGDTARTLARAALVAGWIAALLYTLGVLR